MFKSVENKQAKLNFSYKFISIFILSFIFFFLLLNNIGAITLSCSISATCPYPSVPVFYVQNETSGFDNAHAQNSSSISLEGLELWYRLDNMSYIGEDASTIFDWSGNGRNGTPKLGAVAIEDGRFAEGYYFDKSNDFVSIDEFDVDDDFTVSLWVNPSSTSDGQAFIAKNENVFIIGFYSGGYHVRVRSATFQSGTKTTGWQHILVTGQSSGSNTNITLYKDGVIEWSSIFNQVMGNLINGRNWTLGMEEDSGNPSDRFGGVMDEVMIYSRVLSNDEIQSLYDQEYYRYNFAVCCNADSTLTNSCNQKTIVSLSNVSNAHVQTGDYAGPGIEYDYPVCLSSSPGRVQCSYSTGSCSAGYVCLGSIASSEVGDGNLTNSHFSSCSAYNQKICCRVNTPPVISNVILNSTLRTNLTTENLTVYFSGSDLDSDSFTNITDWRVNGTSIAVLNMPFDTEETSLSIGAIRDYSTFGNNGTLGAGTSSNSPTWTASGKVGGAYDFDGDDYINVSAVPNSQVYTFSSWFTTTQNAPNTDAAIRIITVNRVIAGSKIAIGMRDGGKAMFIWRNSADSSWNQLLSDGNYNDGQWHHIVGTTDGTNFSLYVDGTLLKNSVSTLVTTQYPLTRVGAGADITGGFWDGLIDELIVFNRSLTSEQVKDLYSYGLNGKKLENIVSQETRGGQNWTCLVTGNDGQDGNSFLSNSLVIKNSGPTVTLTSPSNADATTNRTPEFTWSGSDPDGDSLTYQINITAVQESGTSTCSDVRLIATGSNEYYLTTGDLLCLKDNGMIYRWSVRANDGGGYGEWSETRTLNISALLAVSLPVNGIEFGSMTILQQNGTEDDSPSPFIIQNDGNSLLNINASSEGIWNSVAAPNEYYKFKIDNVTGETNAFNWSGSVTNYTNFPVTPMLAVNRLNYTDTRDSVETDIFVQVPPNEPPSFRNSTATFVALLGEV